MRATMREFVWDLLHSGGFWFLVVVVSIHWIARWMGFDWVNDPDLFGERPMGV